MLLVVWLLAALPALARERPRLICLLVVDQLRSDALTRNREFFLPERDGRGRPGGIAYLQARGADHRRCFYDTLPTHTAVGHATLATGAWPSVHGIVGNSWWSSQRQSEQAADEGGRPSALRAGTLGDELKLATAGRSQVISLAQKSRAAVLLGGYQADLAVWQNSEGRWTTSSYYGNLPRWVSEADLDLPRQWEWNGLVSPNSMVRPRDEAGVEELFRGPWPRLLRGVKYVSASPIANRLTFRLAERLLSERGLGRQGPDLLCVSFSAYDKLGHMVGPYHPALQDMLICFDRDLSEFLGRLDEQVGLEHCVVVLTSDHGAGPVPEHEERLPARRTMDAELLAPIEAALTPLLGPGDHVAYLSDPHLVLSPSIPTEKRERARALAAAALADLPGVAVACTRDDILRGSLPRTPLYEAISRSFVADRSGDVYYIQRAYWSYPYDHHTQVGDVHGGPWNYDTHVPLLISGPLIRPGVSWLDCSPRDLAATLSAILGISPPTGCSGRVLVESLLP